MPVNGHAIEMPLCEVCQKNKSFAVVCVPGVPYSAAYCTECFEANAHPYWIVVANTALAGGLEQAADWWKSLVRDTLVYLGKTIEEFNADVAKSIAAQDEVDRDLDSSCEAPPDPELDL